MFAWLCSSLRAHHKRVLHVHLLLWSFILCVKPCISLLLVVYKFDKPVSVDWIHSWDPFMPLRLLVSSSWWDLSSFILSKGCNAVSVIPRLLLMSNLVYVGQPFNLFDFFFHFPIFHLVNVWTVFTNNV